MQRLGGLHRLALSSAAAACSLGIFAGVAAGAQEAYVRVNQVGYASSAAKRAYLMSNFDETGAAFVVRRASDQAVLLSGTVGASVGSWSAAYPDVYALDFDSVQAPGQYTVAVSGAVPAASPTFAIGTASSLYETPLANTLSFYENERDGPEFIPSALRTAPGHLNDRKAMTYLTPKATGEGVFKGDLTSLGSTINAAGGWWDAGDYLKFVQTTSYTVDLLLTGVRDFPAQMGAGSGRSNFTAEAQFGLEWLLHMWDDRTRTLYYQVGIGTGNRTTFSDHDIWRLPQADDTFGGTNPLFRYIRHRPVFRAGPSESPVSPNLAGRDAAAFALCYQVFASSQPAFAARCLRAGEHIFDLANTHPHGHLLTVFPYSFYPEREWRDDLELGATELALALSSQAKLPSGLPHIQSSFYLSQAASWAAAYIARSARVEGDTLNLYDVSGLAHFELVRALRQAAEKTGLAVSEAQLVGNLRSQLKGALAQAGRDPFGFGFPWAAADTTSHGAGLAVMAAEFEYLTGEESFRADGTGWLANILGANAWGSSLIIGDGSTFPQCPQHQVANIVGSLDGSPPVLAGAAVEGPSDETSSGEVEGMRACPPGGGDAFARFDNSAVFADEVQSYTTVEPAIDLTATSPLAFSWQMAQASPLGG